MRKTDSNVLINKFLRNTEYGILNTEAFTLVEMLIVIVVIAIVLGITFPKFRGMSDEADLARAKGELRMLKTGLESYYMHQNPNAYPPTSASLCATYLKNATPQVIEEALDDPFAVAGTEYRYASSANGNYYVIWSIGIDQSADITGIDNNGALSGSDDDDIYVTNGSGF